MPEEYFLTRKLGQLKAKLAGIGPMADPQIRAALEGEIAELERKMALVKTSESRRQKQRQTSRRSYTFAG